MTIDKLLVSKSEKIISALPEDIIASKKATKEYNKIMKEERKKPNYRLPTYHKLKPEPFYLN